MLEINGLCKKYSDGFRVDGLTYRFNTGEKYVVTGSSGCGKTTLLRMMSGVESIDSGEVYRSKVLVGKAGYQMHPSKRGVGMVFQSPALWPHMTIEQQIHYGTKDKERVRELAEVMCLETVLNQYPSELSGGEAKRVALARMLAVDWTYLLLDEPLTNIDSALRLHILQYLDQYMKRNDTTTIYVTHNREDLAEYQYTHLEFNELMEAGDD